MVKLSDIHTPWKSAAGSCPSLEILLYFFFLHKFRWLSYISLFLNTRSSNLRWKIILKVLGEVYLIEHYVKFVSDLEEVGGFFPGTTVSSINKTDRHEITETLLKVALNTINQLNQPTIFSGIKKFTLYYSTWTWLSCPAVLGDDWSS